MIRNEVCSSKFFMIMINCFVFLIFCWNSIKLCCSLYYMYSRVTAKVTFRQKNLELLCLLKLFKMDKKSEVLISITSYVADKGNSFPKHITPLTRFGFVLTESKENFQTKWKCIISEQRCLMGLIWSCVWLIKSKYNV